MGSLRLLALAAVEQREDRRGYQSCCRVGRGVEVDEHAFCVFLVMGGQNWSKILPVKFWPRTQGSSCEIAVITNSWYSEQNGSVDGAFNSSKRATIARSAPVRFHRSSVFFDASLQIALTRALAFGAKKDSG